MLSLIDRQRQHPGHGEARIRLHAGAVNPTDTIAWAGLRKRSCAPDNGHSGGVEVGADDVGPGTKARKIRHFAGNIRSWGRNQRGS